MVTYSTRSELLSLYTRDGVRLDADVYWPQTTQDCPVLLMRQPYGRAIASTVVYAHPSWYAAQGYIVVIQDVRGRGSSEGEFRLFAAEGADGEETVRWAAALPGSNGRVGMYGFSYQGMTQLYAAAARPEALKAICPAMLAYDLYQDWAYEGGAFCLQASLAWAIQIEAETARRRGDAAGFGALALAARQLPLDDPIPAQPEILQRLAPDSFYHDWVRRTDADDPYWRSLQPDLRGVDLPMLHIGGWFDCYLRGTLRLYHAVTRVDSPVRMRSPQALWIGPWAHLPWGQRVGSLDFGPEAQTPIDGVQLRWFDQWLKGQDRGRFEPPVRVFELGRNQWLALGAWPPSPGGASAVQRSRRFDFASHGLASLRQDAGLLVEVAEVEIAGRGIAERLATAKADTIPDWLIHDPWRPVPALGGHSSFPSGPWERGALDGRSDVLTYTSAPLAEDLRICGAIAVTIDSESTAVSFDLCAILSQVFPDGRVYGFSQGYRRIGASFSAPPPAHPPAKALGVPPPSHPAEQLSEHSSEQLSEHSSERQTLQLSLQSICICVPAGHCLRLSLSAACFPAFPVNPGTGTHPNFSTRLDQQIIAIAIHGGSVKIPSTLPEDRAE